MAENLLFEYQYCVGLLPFKPQSMGQINKLRAMADDCGADKLFIYALDSRPNLAAIDVDHQSRADFATVFQFLDKVAPLIHNATGEIECQVPLDASDLAWDYYTVRDNRLMWQTACFYREPRTIMTEVSEVDWKGIQIISYDGVLRFPGLMNGKAEAIDAFVQRAWRTKMLRHDRVDFAYFGGKDLQRWYVRYLMELAEIVGPDVAVEGEIVCSMERFTGGHRRDEYEIYGIEHGQLYRHKGRVERDMDWIETRLND